MKQKLNSILLSIIFVLIGLPLYSDVVLTDAEYEALLKRLKADRTIINVNNKRWNELKTSKPKIEYEIQDKSIVIQTIEIPIYSSNPLKYEVKFKIELQKEIPKFFPWTFFLCGTLESTYSITAGEQFKVYPDVKLGVQFFSLKPLKENLNIGLNAMIGIQSLGGSISYTLPKFLKNTSIHIYFGLNYKSIAEKDPKMAYGLGISLNF